MTNLEIIKINKALYAELLERIPGMEGIERAVAENITLAWIKGSAGKFLGGLGGGKFSNRAYDRAMACGYTLEDVDKEFNRQIRQYIDGGKI